MNEHDRDIAELFAAAEPLPPSAEFAAGLRLAIDRERRKARWLALGGGAAMMLIVVLSVFVAPLESLYPIRIAQGFVTSVSGMFVCAVCAVLMTAWLRVAAD